MSKKHRGAQSVAFEKPVYLIGRGCVGGVMEGKGPLARHFDILASDALWGEDSFLMRRKRRLSRDSLSRGISTCWWGAIF